MIGENTNIGRRNPQPFERIERIEPFEQILSQKKAAPFETAFLKVINLYYSSILILPFDLAITSSATFVGAGA